MLKNFRPFPVTAVTSVIVFLSSFYVYHLADGSALMITNFVLYSALGIFVGKVWSVYPWQIGIWASLPNWVFVAWRFFSTSDPDGDIQNVSVFYWIPMIAMISSYVGTYFGRWLVFRDKKRVVAETGRDNQREK